MLVRNLNTNEGLTYVQQIIRHISQSNFDSNLYCNTAAVGKRGSAVRFTLRVRDSRGVGARRSASGRRTCSATWDAHRQVMDWLFRDNPDAVLVTALATYRGQTDFLRKYPATYDKNAGSMFNPVAFGDL